MPLSWDYAFFDAIVLLATLYPDPDKARLVIRQSGLDPTDIDFSGAPKIYWMRVVEAANRRDKVLTLLRVVSRDYDDRSDVTTLLRQMECLPQEQVPMKKPDASTHPLEHEMYMPPFEGNSPKVQWPHLASLEAGLGDTAIQHVTNALTSLAEPGKKKDFYRSAWNLLLHNLVDACKQGASGKSKGNSFLLVLLERAWELARKKNVKTRCSLIRRNQEDSDAIRVSSKRIYRHVLAYLATSRAVLGACANNERPGMFSHASIKWLTRAVRYWGQHSSYLAIPQSDPARPSPRDPVESLDSYLRSLSRDSFERGVGATRDCIRFLMNYPSRIVRRKACVTLFSGEDRNVVGHLHFELIEDGACDFYSAIDRFGLSLLQSELLRELSSIWEAVLAISPRQPVDIRWRIAASNALAFSGDGIRASATVALLRLLRDESSEDSCALIADVAKAGRLAPVDHVAQKTLAFFQNLSKDSLVNGLVIVHPENQRQACEAAVSADVDPTASVRIASTLDEAFKSVEYHSAQCWPGIDCIRPFPPVDFIGREELFRVTKTFSADPGKSGYLVLVGGMGIGKSAFVAELIQREWIAGANPVFHIISYNPRSSGDPEVIANCLYQQLRRKYNLALPETGFATSASAASRLEGLLHRISQAILPRTNSVEVLYIDAADQAESTLGKPLLPDTLRQLPRGVYCIISSRTQLHWLRTSSSVTTRQFASQVEDRLDIQLFLSAKKQAAFPKLPDALISAVTSSPDPPVFLTIVNRLRQLSDNYTSLEVKRELLGSADKWLVPPEQLVHDELLRLLEQSAAFGIAQHVVLRTIGVIACAREALSENQLRELEFWESGTAPQVLRFAANFFSPRPLLPAPLLCWQFDHPGYQREVIACLGSVETAAIHNCFSEACLKVLLSDSTCSAKEYAARHFIYHSVVAGQQDRLCLLICSFRGICNSVKVLRSESALFFRDLISHLPVVADSVEERLRHIRQRPELFSHIIAGVVGALPSGPLRLDPHATCNLCYHRGLFHGVLVASFADYWTDDNRHIVSSQLTVASLCSHCYWHYLQLAAPNSASGISSDILLYEQLRFNYKTNVYDYLYDGEVMQAPNSLHSPSY